MTFTRFPTSKLQEKQLCRCEGDFALFTKEPQVSSGKQAFAKGEQYPAIIKVLRQLASLYTSQSKMLFFFKGKMPRPVAQLLMPHDSYCNSFVNT